MTGSMDPFASETTEQLAEIPANSPISAALREAITWARHNGVVEMELPCGRFILKPAVTGAGPTMADLKDKLSKRTLAPGGYDQETLFAASPSPYIPDSETPLVDPAKDNAR